jgi:hypothetical protein
MKGAAASTGTKVGSRSSKPNLTYRCRDGRPAQAERSSAGFACSSEYAQETDVGLSYVRPAKLEAQAGNAQLSEEYVALAQDSFKAAGRDYSRDDVMKRVSGL